MTDDKSALDDLLQSVGRQKKKPSPITVSAGGPKVLSPLDVLLLPTAQRKIVNHLSRRKQSRLVDMKRWLRSLSKEEIEQAVRELKEAGYLREALVNGEIYYRVILGGKVGRNKALLPTDKWAQFNADSLTFLKQMPMFRDVSRLELQAMARQMNIRLYRRDEVIVWQGESSEDAFLIKNGIVGISSLSPDMRSGQILAYLKQGDIVGEIGVLENQVRSATAVALSNVEVLVIKRAQFLSLLEKYDTAALELARMLGRQLITTSARLSHTDRKTHLILVFRVAGGTGGTTISSALAATMARETQQATVYTEYPDPSPLPDHFGLAGQVDTYHHPAGYDIYLPQVDPSLPGLVDVTLMIDRLLNRYANIIIGLPDDVDEGTHYMLERANQIVLIVPPDQQAWEQLKMLRNNIRDRIRADKTGLLTVINRPRPEDKKKSAPGPVDFDLPFLGELPSKQTDTSLPEPLVELTKTIMNRVGRTSEIAVYIPTTTDINQGADTTPYIKEVMAFMGEHFGGATKSMAEGVWDSEEAGLVNEAVYIIRSFVTPESINTHLDPLLEYIAKLKEELHQEAMAVEIDRKLMLV